MNAASQTKNLLGYSNRPNAAGCQDTLPGRYRGWVMALSMAAFSLAFLGWFNYRLMMSAKSICDQKFVAGVPFWD
ncbi:MAG: hypothetical protein ABW138_20630 [Candidatus Thiodiazotropha sp. 4PDIVS1]